MVERAVSVSAPYRQQQSDHLKGLVCSANQDLGLSYILRLANAGRHGVRTTPVHITGYLSNDGTTRMQPNTVTTQIRRTLIVVESKLIWRLCCMKSAISKLVHTVVRKFSYLSGQSTFIEGSRQFAHNISV